MQPQDTSQIASLVASIRGLHQLFEQSISEIKSHLDHFESIAPSEDLLRRADYWQVVIAYDCSVRLRQIIENNFVVIETLALLATVRYIFELSIWLKLASSQPEYALVYYAKLLEKESEHSDGMARQLQREIELLEAFESHDTQSAFEVLNKIKQQADHGSTHSVQQLVHESRLDVDRLAARTFSLYVDRATQHGFGYTAHLVRTQALGNAQERQQQAAMAIEELKSWCPANSLALVNRKWKWDREAKAANMDGPYDYLYSYVSRLLHATPSSVTTDQKNLEPDEIRIFLRYIHGALLDAIDLVGRFRTL
jgi:hypothetical protein